RSNLNVSRPQIPVPSSLSSIVHIHEKKATHLSIEDLANWLANPKIKNNPSIINKKVPKTDTEWFDLMEKSPSRSQKKPQHQKVWQKEIQTTKDMFKVDGIEYTFLTWFATIEEDKIYEAKMTKEHGKKILNTIDNDKFLIRIKFIRPDYDNFKIVNKYEPIRESKKIEIDNKFFVRAIQIKTSDFEILKNNAVIYGLYRIREPDSNRLMPIKDGALNCVAQQVIEHFEKAKREHNLTSIHRQKIDIWKKRIHQPGARVEDVAELEKILKRPIKLLDITHGTIFNSEKYQTGRYEEIEMVVHNGHAFSRNHHFPRDRMVKYYNDNAWNTINKALQDSQAIWLIGLRLGEGEILEEIQSVMQFVLEDSYTFRTWIKHTDIVKAYKELFEDMLAEQVFEANHAESKLANEINNWHPTPASVHENIKQSYMKECYPAIAVNGELPQDDITGFVQIRSFKFVFNIHLAIPVWYGKHFACRSGEGCGK
ncbi:23198_t:CDS:2, partial [Racocetra persica]